MASILVLDDDPGMREFLEILLSREGYKVTCAADAEKALALCKKMKFDLILTDLKMPKVDGIEFLKRSREIIPETMVILMTAYASGETAVSAMKEGAYDYIEKDFDVDELKALIQQALNKKGIQKENAQFIKDVEGAVCFGQMIGNSKEILKVYALINKVSATSANVLILGESGTGKELAARAIHENSARANMPFIAINCGGIPETLLESELFGYMKGSFTGAYADKPGLFEMADNGTIFLDEIGELPSVLQVKLLRVVQEKTFRRIGGHEDIKVNVRIISATNQNLANKVKSGSFREDLYYRLNVIPIHLPPLRERKDDIPILTKHFIEKYSKDFNKEIRNISLYALELLMEYQFPGNIRELENIIERSVALETSNIILPENLILSKDIGKEESVQDVSMPLQGIELNRVLADYERMWITRALERSGGSKTKAAELLHISFDSLRYRIEKLGMQERA